ncbi:MAG: ATP-binding cassette domain-containing protein, partial [Clostridia bacterium]|nr:ATP-binding cassette domain-containing protein [Clostridia bacterium]
MNILKLLSVILLDSSFDFTLIFAVLYIVGLWGLFKKSGIDSRWALVPVARQYQLARCAGRESEGRVYSVVALGSIILSVLTILMNFTPTEAETVTGRDLLLTVLTLSLLMVQVIYHIRVVMGLIEVYGVKKRWMWLWLTSVTYWIPALLWGFNPKYQPAWKVEDIKAELEKLAHQGSADVMDEGLTVNLRDRTVTEFFQKKVLLRDIHMAIPQGHMVLLLGGSGAGKTTYLNAINGYEPAKAEVLLNGTNMYKHYKKMQYEVGFVPQSEMMRGKDTVYYTLLDAAKLRLPQDVSAAQRKARVEEVMEIFGLTPVK